MLCKSKVITGVIVVALALCAPKVIEMYTIQLSYWSTACEHLADYGDHLNAIEVLHLTPETMRKMDGTCAKLVRRATNLKSLTIADYDLLQPFMFDILAAKPQLTELIITGSELHTFDIAWMNVLPKLSNLQLINNRGLRGFVGEPSSGLVHTLGKLVVVGKGVPTWPQVFYALENLKVLKYFDGVAVDDTLEWRKFPRLKQFNGRDRTELEAEETTTAAPSSTLDLDLDELLRNDTDDFEDVNEETYQKKKYLFIGLSVLVVVSVTTVVICYAILYFRNNPKEDQVERLLKTPQETKKVEETNESNI